MFSRSGWFRYMFFGAPEQYAPRPEQTPPAGPDYTLSDLLAKERELANTIDNLKPLVQQQAQRLNDQQTDYKSVVESLSFASITQSLATGTPCSPARSQALGQVTEALQKQRAQVEASVAQLAQLVAQRHRIQRLLNDCTTDNLQGLPPDQYVALKLAEARQTASPEEQRLAFVQNLIRCYPNLRCDQPYIAGAKFCPRCGREMQKHLADPFSLPWTRIT